MHNDIYINDLCSGGDKHMYDRVLYYYYIIKLWLGVNNMCETLKRKIIVFELNV